MSRDADDVRRELHEFIKEHTPFDTEPPDGTPDAGFPTAWVLLVEFQGSDGQRWMSKLSADAMGEEELPAWTLRGLCFEVAHHWKFIFQGDDDEAEG